MILRRVMQNIKEQNWFALSSELLVLVVGIFLGLQANNWNEERIDRNDERVYLERLLLDSDNTIAANETLILSMNSRKAGREEFMSMLESKSFNTQNIPRISQLFITSMRDFDNLIYYEDTMDELTSTGKLSVIESRDFKTKMARFRAEVERNERILNVLTGSLVNNGIRMSEMLTWNVQGELLLTSPEELNNNIMIYRQSVSLARTLMDMHDYELYFQDQIKAFREEIAKELERLK